MIVIIGKSGQLSQSLVQLCNDTGQACIALGRDDIDLLDFHQLEKTISQHKVSSIINASAYTAVDKAETDKQAAYDLNDKAIGNLAKIALSLNVQLVHVSTDYVFAGDKGSPYLPTDQVAPTGVYGASKAAGEKTLLNENPNGSCILRTSWVYSKYGNNFVKTMIRLMKEKPSLGVIDDQIGSPTAGLTLAKACLIAANHGLSGIHHISDEGVASWYDFAVEIQRLALKYQLLDREIPIKPIPSSEYPTPAKRPHYSVLSKASIKQAMPSLELMHWSKALEEVIKDLD